MNNDIRPELGENDHAEWMGFTIKRKLDFSKGQEQEGYVVIKGACNIMPGATWFKSLAQARKGIAAYVLACKIAPRPRDPVSGIEAGCEGDIFWAIWELTK